MCFWDSFCGVGAERLKTSEMTQPFGKPLSASILIQDLTFEVFSLHPKFDAISLLPEKLSSSSQATNAQGWIVLLKEASLCSADNQTNGYIEIGHQGEPTAAPSLIQAWAVSLLIGAHNPISANGSYVLALLETIGCLRGTIVLSNWGDKHDWLFLHEGPGWAPKPFLR